MGRLVDDEVDDGPSMYLREDILRLGDTFTFFADIAGDKHAPVTALQRGSLALLVFPTSLFRGSVPDTGGGSSDRPFSLWRTGLTCLA
jgi:hypothetical protein